MAKPYARNRVKRSERVEADASTTRGMMTSQRCRVTHDVPYTLRCVLHEGHVHVVVHSAVVQSGEFAGATVVTYQPHQDKDGRTW
jgi:nitrogenase subunit NifH